MSPHAWIAVGVIAGLWLLAFVIRLIVGPGEWTD